MSNILDRTGQLTAGFVQVDIVARFRPRYALFSSLSSIVKLSKGRTPGRSVELTPPDIHSTTTTAAQFPINNPPARLEEAAAEEAVPAATGLGTRTAAGPAASRLWYASVYILPLLNPYPLGCVSYPAEGLHSWAHWEGILGRTAVRTGAAFRIAAAAAAHRRPRPAWESYHTSRHRRSHHGHSLRSRGRRHRLLSDQCPKPCRRGWCVHQI